MTATELEYAACRPYRIKRVLESATPHVHRHRTLAFAKEGDIIGDSNVTHTITFLEVVPGGRYLITTSESGWIRCWDLVSQLEGQDDKGYIAMKPKAEYYAGEGIQGLWAQESVESPSKIVIVIDIESPNSNDSDFRMLMLHLPEKSSLGLSFELQTSFLHPWITMWFLEGDYLIYADSDMLIYVLNWKEGVWGAITNLHINQVGLITLMANIMLVGLHIVIFTNTLEGIAYQVYALPDMHPSKEAALADAQDTLIDLDVFAPEATDVDFPLYWRPAMMNDSIGFVVVSYTTNTRIFYLRLPETDSMSRGNTEADHQNFSNSPTHPIGAPILTPGPYLTDTPQSVHVRITPSFSSAYMVWFDQQKDWWILPIPRVDHGSNHVPPLYLPASESVTGSLPHNDALLPTLPTPASDVLLAPHSPTSAPIQLNSEPPFKPGLLGHTPHGSPPLCLSPEAGQIFYIDDDDSLNGYVHLWDWVIPQTGDPLGEADIAEHLVVHRFS
ncbi:hypothetical protein DL93DRAFT_2167211 [Clavulina sp. PMI_390]|nr:hypothetical protein DL93DRAFT_2167211 [Clavulina sp. PMI_390]